MGDANPLTPGRRTDSTCPGGPSDEVFLRHRSFAAFAEKETNRS
jgi:hypothetical protein